MTQQAASMTLDVAAVPGPAITRPQVVELPVVATAGPQPVIDRPSHASFAPSAASRAAAVLLPAAVVGVLIALLTLVTSHA